MAIMLPSASATAVRKTSLLVISCLLRADAAMERGKGPDGARAKADKGR
jgi:hypothetical protein